LAFAAMILSVAGVNFIAYMQARAMTHFVEGGDRTRPPESLGFLRRIEIILVGVRVPRPTDDANPSDVGLPFETFRFGGQGGDDCEAWFIRAKNSKGLCIAFHSYAASKSSLLQPATAFHDLGYDVLLVDFRGSGGSRGNDTTIGYREAEDAAAAVDFASHKWPRESEILYGQSMGGAAILRAVGELHVQPSAVIIESTFDRMLSTVENRFHAMGLPAFPLARLLVFWGGEQFGYSAFNLNPADYATQVHCPVLMMQGSLDRRVTDAQARNLFDHLAGPKQFELFDNAGHCAFLEMAPDRWNKTVAGFLANSLHR
jgi:alpha-beta hydrolase superfamily lysophospholipase